jgi:hypothetical protein
MSISYKRKGRCPAPPLSEGTFRSGGVDATRFARVPQKMCRCLVGIALAAGLAAAQAPILTGPLYGGLSLRFTATTDNVGGAPDSIRIDLLRWSTDAERDQLMSAWNMTNGAGRAGRGGGRGAAGRGAGRGRADETPAPTPESTLADALKQAPTVGYLWSSEVAGYALRYAGRLAGPDGMERIILITDRRLGAINDLWTPVGKAIPNRYGFSVIELRVNSKGEGEGKISLIGKVTPDGAAKIVAPENYGELPVMLKNVKRQATNSH